MSEHKTKPEGPAPEPRIEPTCKCGHLERWHDTNGSVCEYRGCQCARFCDVNAKVTKSSRPVPATAAPSQPAAREWAKQLITGVDGDCLRAAFANCLGLPIESVPHFENDAWFDSWTAWFRERGIGLVWYGFRDGLSYGFPGLYVLSVKSPRLEGKKHCVVARDGQIVFDPHPDADNTPADPATANGAYLFTILDAQQSAAKDAALAEIRDVTETSDMRGIMSLRRIKAIVDAALKAGKDGQQ